MINTLSIYRVNTLSINIAPSSIEQPFSQPQRNQLPLDRNNLVLEEGNSYVEKAQLQIDVTVAE